MKYRNLILINIVALILLLLFFFFMFGRYEKHAIEHNGIMKSHEALALIGLADLVYDKEYSTSLDRALCGILIAIEEQKSIRKSIGYEAKNLEDSVDNAFSGLLAKMNRSKSSVKNDCSGWGYGFEEEAN